MRAQRNPWVAVPPAERIRLIEELRRDVARVADAWASAVAEIEGLTRAEAAEETIAGPYLTLRNLRLLKSSLNAPTAPVEVFTSACRRTPISGREVPVVAW